MKHPFLLLIIASMFTLSQLPAQAQNATYLRQTGIADSVYSDILKESRHFWVELPPSYDPAASQKFPVVYVLDGGELLPAVAMAQHFYSGGFFPEMIVVGISNRTHRTRDLTPSVITQRFGMPYPEETGGAEVFTQFLEKELMPAIEKKYHATAYKTLIGHSYGGLFAINTLLNHPGLFNNYLAIDPSLDWDDQKLIQQAKVTFEKTNFNGKKLFISLSGQLHMQRPEITLENVKQDTSSYTLFPRSNLAFTELAKKYPHNGLQTDWKFYPNDLHGTVPLPSIIDGMISLFSWFQMENVTKFNSPESKTADLVDIIRYREKKLARQFGYSVPPLPEDMLNMLGYMNLEWGNPESSKAFFELCIEYFPQSANAYDSLADYYAAMGDFANALKHVSNAFELRPSEYYKGRMEEFSHKK